MLERALYQRLSYELYTSPFWTNFSQEQLLNWQTQNSGFYRWGLGCKQAPRTYKINLQYCKVYAAKAVHPVGVYMGALN